MSEKDDPLFPADWGWDSYEPAMREMAAQVALYSRDEPSLRAACRTGFELWFERAVDEGRLPPFDERQTKGDAYIGILDALVDDAGRQFDEGTLDIGLEGLSLFAKSDPGNVGPNLPDNECAVSPAPGDPIFPPDWGWQRHEPAFRELMQRIALTQETDAPHGRVVNTGVGLRTLDYEGVKMERWWDRQVASGRLPPDHQMFDFDSPRSDQLDAIFDGKLAAARLRIRSERKTLTIFGERPSLADTYNPPSGELVPENSNSRPPPARPGPHGPAPTSPINNRDSGRRRR